MNQRITVFREERLTEENLQDYNVKLVWHSRIPYNPLNEAMDVRLILKDGREYATNFVTRRFIDDMFAKNRNTGECSNGTYYAMPGMIIVDEINEFVVRRTIDDMARNRELENYFISVTEEAD